MGRYCLHPYPVTIFVVCSLYSRFYHGSKDYEPLSDGTKGSSRIWVHIVCNKGYLKHKRAYSKSHDWGNGSNYVLET